MAGNESVFRAEGRYECRQDSVTVSYKQDADSVELVATKRAFSMSRKGETGLSMVFCGGEETRATLTAAGGEGYLCIFTEKYERRRLADGFCITLKYELGVPQNAERYHLEIFVKTDSEEK
ncbi:MAG: DUF1934 domain-containing protein [Clostridiales bacterium]|nr:DUF1934 domain-containing protein [Clostridiales bacterium]